MFSYHWLKLKEENKNITLLLLMIGTPDVVSDNETAEHLFF